MHNSIVYGIDIAKGSVRSQQFPKYAVAILKDGLIERHNMLSRQRIFKMVHIDKPEYIAVDNIFELASDKNELMRFLEKLPDKTKLIQVTGGLHLRPLLKLAQENGINMNQFNPGDEAEACARLAALGIGSEVSLFEDMTKIKISRARSLGRGGWSQNRYRRKVHGAVKEKSRIIEQILIKFSKEYGVTFTSKSIAGFGGYVRTEFIVNTKREKIPVHPCVTADVQVTIQSVQRDKIKYISLTPSKRKYTIVGIDPGTTVGIAILSLDGKVLYSNSFRGISHDDVVKLIADYGKPAIVATDVRPTPDAVEKIRRSFQAVLGSPTTQLRSEDKIALAKPFGYNNDHERDSLSAALITYRNYKNIFSRIEKKIPPFTDLESAKYHVINGDSIEEAIAKVTDASAKLKPKTDVTSEHINFNEHTKKLNEIISSKNEQIDELKQHVRELEIESIQKDKFINGLEIRILKLTQSQALKLRKDQEIQTKEKEVIRLKTELKKIKKALHDSRFHIKKLKQIRKKEFKGKGLPVKIIHAFNKESILKTEEKFALNKGDVVYLQDSSGGGSSTASILVEKEIKAVIIKDDISHAAQETFFKSNIPVLKDILIQRLDDFAIVDPDILEKEISLWEERTLVKKREKDEEHLALMLDEYRSKRRRGLL